MDTTTITLDSVARAIGCSIGSDEELRDLLQESPLVFAGFGSIARPASEELARRGARRFVLVDPKRYVAYSVHSQCTDADVGRCKVDVGLERLRASGANVTTYARDIASVPEGVISRESIVIATVDNRRGDIGANRAAERMGARFIKVNVEPALGVAVARAYDFRCTSPLCVECQFGNHHYSAQRHPRSCDGRIAANGERRTNSPRWLSQAAASLAVLATLDLVADEGAAEAWVGRERQYFHETGKSTSSWLEPNPNCRSNHTERWPNIVRLSENEATISLRELFLAAKIDFDARAKIRFCQQVALRARCSMCRTDSSVVCWSADTQAPVGTCEVCGSPLLPIPFAVFTEMSTEPLLAVMDRPLGEWGVERSAVIEVSRDERRVSFVVGGASTG